ncbi:MAG: disulfide bond formation protein B [Pseudomonadota bacterium]
MSLTRNTLILLAAGGSLALLIAAWIFQAFGWAPCQMCLWQRWPHGAAIALGVAALALPGRILPLLGGLAAATTAAIALFHTGVERKWWEGITACASGDGISGMSTADLLDTTREVGPPLIRCDAFDPLLFGLTMANANALASLALMGLWLWAARQPALTRA